MITGVPRSNNYGGRVYNIIGNEYLIAIPSGANNPHEIFFDRYNMLCSEVLLFTSRFTIINRALANKRNIIIIIIIYLLHNIMIIIIQATVMIIITKPTRHIIIIIIIYLRKDTARRSKSDNMIWV